MKSLIHNPYNNLPETAFWKTAVANKNMFDIEELWLPKFPLMRQHKVATFGSCFAQHIGKSLTRQGFSWLNTEPEPFGLSVENSKLFNYNIFSCRTGNIYTTSLLKQWVEWALQMKEPVKDCWSKDSRFFDPFRPNIEPNGFESNNEMIVSRQEAIGNFSKCIKQSDVFIFTLGLTESWFNQQHGYEYPMCPGTVAGDFDSSQHVFLNQRFNFIRRNLEDAILMMRKENEKLRVILTVSPVPLTATNSQKHVLLATMESKSILRAVAGEMANDYDFVDYFPSYEIINSTPFKGVFFEANQRSVSQHGVNFVMNAFFKCLQMKYGDLGEKSSDKQKQAILEHEKSEDDVICEEMILEAFGS